MKRRPLIAANWKMNGTRETARSLAKAVQGSFTAEVVLCPPFVHLGLIEADIMGAQDVSVHDDGAYTGEVSAAMLADMGCKYVIVGHSERRQYFEETDHLIAQKAAKVLVSGMIPVICIGETLAQRQTGQTAMVIESQLAGSLPVGATGQNIVIAYEPVWAIGTGQVATTAQIAEVHQQIRENLENRLAEAQHLRIIYGGSVKPDNAAEILSLDHVDGALVGGASLKADSFLAIVNSVKV